MKRCQAVAGCGCFCGRILNDSFDDMVEDALGVLQSHSSDESGKLCADGMISLGRQVFQVQVFEGRWNSL
jgi:hypothetical protein